MDIMLFWKNNSSESYKFLKVCYSIAMEKLKYILLIFFAMVTLSYPRSSTAITDNKIQGRLNHVNGHAAECVMHKFYTNSGWTQIEGEIGRNGIDGLYYKKKKGTIREVLVAESKWNTSKLGWSGKNKNPTPEGQVLKTP